MEEKNKGRAALDLPVSEDVARVHTNAYARQDDQPPENSDQDGTAFSSLLLLGLCAPADLGAEVDV